jgi:hypothetical protein
MVHRGFCAVFLLKHTINKIRDGKIENLNLDMYICELKNDCQKNNCNITCFDAVT